LKAYQDNIGELVAWEGFSSCTKNKKKAFKANTLFSVDLE